MSDEQEEDEEIEKCNGYCHFNEGNECNTFSISVFGHELVLAQNPSSRTLGHGAVVWDAAVVFIKFMEHDPKTFSSSRFLNKEVLELGSGCSLAGLGPMIKGAKVTFTDLPDVVDQLTRINANKVYKQLTSRGKGSGAPVLAPIVHAIDWTTFSVEEIIGLRNIAVEAECSVPATSPPPYDFILLTDCVFSVSLVPHLIRILRDCSGLHTEIYCCHEIRDEEANALFVVELKKYFAVKRVPRSKLHPDYQSDQIELLIAKPLREKKLKSNSSA